jgi:hypothetical protein
VQDEDFGIDSGSKREKIEDILERRKERETGAWVNRVKGVRGRRVSAREVAV